MADPLIGKTVGQYQIVESAGQGGMATVYKAYQPSLNRYVALKVLPDYLAHDDEFVKRFKQEATAAAALRHPNIIVIYDIGEADNVHYIATEFLEGQTLDAVLKQSGSLPLLRVVDSLLLLNIDDLLHIW
jgi:serine/threonine protein kinase